MRLPLTFARPIPLATILHLIGDSGVRYRAGSGIRQLSRTIPGLDLMFWTWTRAGSLQDRTAGT
jgi:hypothetical protein